MRFGCNNVCDSREGKNLPEGPSEPAAPSAILKLTASSCPRDWPPVVAPSLPWLDYLIDSRPLNEF